ncbi:MAG TPA: hemerythrin domain-containing protein [Casimicrobiaceae bacterium]|nr:hemerythrin domain-containing protein [Casimicrobiaceae bacterium]
MTQDHREVQKMFRKAERMDGGDRALQEIVEAACAALTLHAEIEEQVFYPAIQEQSSEQDLVQEALVEHESAKQLIAQLEAIGPDDERYKATFKVLGEYVNHHIQEEESRIFRAARRAKIDLDAIGEQIMMLKEGGAAAGEQEASGAERRARGSSSRSSRSASGGSRARGERSSRGSTSSGSRTSEEQGSQAALDEESEPGAMSRTGGDSGEDTERPGRGGRHAGSSVEDVDEGDAIDVRTPGGSSRYDTH